MGKPDNERSRKKDYAAYVTLNTPLIISEIIIMTAYCRYITLISCTIFTIFLDIT